MPSAHLRNYAKAARMIASFRDLQIDAVCRGEPEAGRIVIRNVSRPVGDEGMTAIILDTQDPAVGPAHLADLGEADESIHLGQRFAELARKTLRHASAHDQLLAGFFPESALLMGIENCFDRFFLR